MPLNLPNACATLAATALLAGVAPLVGRAQDAAYTVRRLTSDDGLPTPTVYDVEVDAAGWLYVATDAGLYRYDGVDFLRVPAPRARHRECHNLFRGPRGELYVQNFRRQLFVLRGDTLREHADLAALGNEYLSAVPLAGGILVRSSADVRLLAYAPPLAERDGSDATRRPESVVLDSLGGRYTGLAALDGSRALLIDRTAALTGTLGPGRREAFTPVAGARGPVAATVDGRRRIFETAGARVVVRDSAGAVLREAWPALPTPQVWRAAVQLPGGRLLVGSNKGLRAAARGDEAWSLISPGDVSAILPDGRGGFWVGTLDRGLLRVSRRDYAAWRYPGLANGILDLAAAPDGSVYGVNRAFELFALGAAPRPLLRTRKGRALHRDHAGRVRFDLRYVLGGGGVADTLSLGSDARQLKVVKAAAPMTRDGVFALAGGSGLHVYDERAQRLHVLSGKPCVDVAYDRKRRRGYAVTTTQLLPFGEEGLPEAAVALPGDPAGLAVLGGTLFVATRDRGLFAFDGARFPTVTATRGRQVSSLDVADGALWVSSELGVERCRPLGTPGEDPRLACDRVALPAVFSGRRPIATQVCADTLLVLFDLAVARLPLGGSGAPSPAIPAPRFVGLGGDARAGQLQPETVELAADEDELAFALRAPYYPPAGGEVAYRYRVLPGDTAWRRAAGPRPRVYLAGLPSGRHRVEVAVDRPGAPVSAFAVVARLPLARRPLTWALGVAAVAMVVGVAYRRRMLRRRREAELRGELRRSRLTAIAAQMNPHFVFNALHSVQEFILGNDVERANHYLARFARLMRMTLDLSRAEDIAVAEEVEAMRLYAALEERRFDGLVTARIEVASEVPLAARIPPLLVQPHLENAFKHGMGGRSEPGGLVAVRYALGAAGELVVEVRDNGRGRAATLRRSRRSPDGAAGGGFGASASAERVALLNQLHRGGVEVVPEDLYGAGDEAAGTRVTLRIPLTDERVPSTTIDRTHA